MYIAVIGDFYQWTTEGLQATLSKSCQISPSASFFVSLEKFLEIWILQFSLCMTMTPLLLGTQ